MTIKAFRINKAEAVGYGQEREVKLIILLTGLFAACMITGAGSVSAGTDICEFLFSERNNYRFYQAVSDAIIKNILVAAIIFVSGLNCIGALFSMPVTVFAGVCYGIISGYLFDVHKLSGMGFYITAILPGALFTAFLIIISSSLSIDFSLRMFCLVTDKKCDERNSLKMYIKKFSLLFLFCVIAGVIEGVIFTFFSSMYNL